MTELPYTNIISEPLNKFTLFLRSCMLLLLVSAGLSASAQVVIYQQNFDGNNGSFSNAILSSSTPNNGWLANNTAAQYGGVYRHIWNLSTLGSGNYAPISGRSLGIGLFNGNNPLTGGAPFQYWYSTNCNIFATTYRWAYVPISTVGYSNITVEFKWRMSGEVDGGVIYDYGTVNTSLDGGVTWLLDQSGGQGGTTGANGTYTGGLYTNSATTQTATITLPSSRDDQPNFALAFRAVIDQCYGTGGSFIIDDIIVRGTPLSSCFAGTASPAFQYVPTNGTADMSLTGYVGSTIQWQRSPDGSTGWTNVSGGSGATTDNYTSGSLADGTYYYRAVVTDGGACTEYSNVIEVLVAANPVYCSGAGSGNAYSNNHIEEVGFHEWSDPNPGNFSNNYIDYSDTTTYGYATVVPGQYHHFAATIRANGSGAASTTVAAWIDFNGDGVFDNTSINSGGELIDIVNFSSTVANTYAAYFTVPLTASGLMRMRVRALRGSFGSIDPCGVYTNSQTKDLTVLAIPAISGGQVCGTVNGSGDLVTANSAVDKVNISRVLVNGPSGTVLDVNGGFFGVQAGSTITMYNYSNMMGGYSNGLVMESGANYTVNVEHSGYNSVVGLFIDWNGDGDFDDANEIVGRTASNALNPYIFNFTAPTGLTDGMQVAMRVRLYYDDFSVYGGSITACGNISDGLQQYSEVEDYRVTLSVVPMVCAPVSNLAAAIGTPANGLEHHMDVTWDALPGATGYDIEYSNNGSSWTSLGSTATNSYDHNFGDNPNVAMYYRVRAKDASTTCAWSTMVTPVYTACDLPEVPTTSNVTTNSIDLDIVAETPVANPAITTYSIYDENTGLYVQANGSLGATEVFQTKAVWGTVTVTGLSATTEYCFVLTAKNFDGDERGGSGASLQSLQTFDSSGDLVSTGSSTTVWYSPGTCGTGPQVWDGSNGCTGGAVGFSGAWNSFFGCYLRSPEVNCTGLSTAVMTFDISNSYFASQPNDGVHFNMWAPTAGSPGGTYIRATSIKIGGVEVGASDINGYWLRFDQARSCESVTVTYDLSTVTDKSAILFYLNASCGYNNSNVFSYWSDNISINEPVATACATTLGTAPDLVVQSITPLSGSACGAAPVSFEVVVENQGTADILSGTNFDVAAYVGNLACTGTAVATQTITTGLAASASTTLTFSLSLAGSSDVSFEVDAGGVITESDEANNCDSDNTVTVGSGLGGLYTIDATVATGGTNYNSFTDAAADLNAYGVCAAVIFDVATDTYTETITLTDVAGVSAVNTVTFRSASGVASQVTLQSGTSSDVVVLHNADYHRFENMTIQYTGSSGYSAIELQDDADNTIISGCILSGSTTTGATNSYATIYVSESSTSLLIDDLTIDNCEINKGSYGIYFASGSVESTDIVVTNNTFGENSRGAVFLDDCIAPIVSGNTITSASDANSSYTGIEIAYGSTGSVVTKNIITSEYIKTGIEINNTDATALSPTLVANNFIAIGGSFNAPRGIDINGSDYVDIYFNSVHMYNSSTTFGNAALYIGGTIADGSINVVNNILASTNGGSTHIAVYLASTNNRVDLGTIDYNNYYVTGSASVGYSSGYQDFASWQTLLSGDANSMEVDPLFASNTDLHVSEMDLIDGTSLAAVTDDIDGDSRQPTPTIGADEFFVAAVADDAGVSDMITPSIPPCPGNSAFEVEVTNYGTNTLTSVTVEWSVNGVAQTPVTATGLSVTTGNSTNVSLGTFNLLSNTAYEFIFNTSLPNGNVDGNLLNDTLTLSNQYTSLNGTYTIGGASPDFATFNDAVDALHAYGVCGPVIFNVRQGTYTEQVEINAIGGVSAVNTVTFQGDPANTLPAILQYNSQGFSDNFVLGIYGSSYLRFKNLNISTTASGSYRRVIAFTQANYDIQFTSNIIEAPLSSSNSTNQALIFGDGDVAYTDDNILFDGNLLLNGSYAILMDGASSAYENDLVITANTITGFYAYGIQVNYRTNVTIDNNIIRNGVATANATGIDLFNVDGDLSIQKNIIECSGSTNPKTGIETGQTNLTSGNRGVIANNFVSVEGTSTCYGIELGSTTSYVDVIFNNVYTNGTNSTSTRALYTNGASNIKLYNNNLIAGGAGYAMYISSPITALVESDYNNFYTGNTEFIYRSGNQADLATWQGLGLGYDANSVSMDPQYTSTTSPMDLHISETALSGAGVTFGGITTDIDGDARTAPPTIGADEITAGCGVNAWTGTISNDWHVDGNWGCGVVPTKTTVVYIPSAPVNQPIVYTGFKGVCLSLEMETGSELIIQEGAILEVAEP